jgi:hypothetical protein
VGCCRHNKVAVDGSVSDEAAIIGRRQAELAADRSKPGRIALSRSGAGVCSQAKA